MMKQENTAAFYGWKNCPPDVKQKTGDILAFFQSTFGNDLTGFYLHGSLAMDSFNPATSDIDLIAVVEKTLTASQKQIIITYFQNIDKGPASPEMSIVTAASLQNLVYPTPFELHYSNGTRDVYTSGQVAWEQQRFDTDLPAHFMAIQERGICLYGKPFKEIMPQVPQEMFMASIVQDLHWIKQEINRLPFRYTVLNPCRALAYARESIYLSKKEGAEWALTQLPSRYGDLIETALNAYSGVPTAVPPSQDTLAEFLDYAVKEFIYSAAKTDAENLFFKRSYEYGRQDDGS